MARRLNKKGSPGPVRRIGDAGCDPGSGIPEICDADPALMTHRERQREMATLLARGFLRARQDARGSHVIVFPQPGAQPINQQPRQEEA